MSEQAVPEGLERVLDDHAELRDVIAQIGEAGDPGILSGLLQRLRDLLHVHFAREEADPGLMGLFARATPEAMPGEATGSIPAEHRALVGGLDALIDRVETERGRGAAAFGPDVERFLERLAAHDARETRLLGDRVAAQPPTSTGAGAGSRALEVNLRRTAIEVVIPPPHAVLLDIVAPRHGVHEATRKLLREIHHRYAGWEQALEDLHRRATSDLHYYLEDARAAEAIGVFFSLYARVAEHADAVVRESAVRRWLYYLEKLVGDSGTALPALAPTLKQGLSRLGAILEASPRIAAAVSPRLRRLVDELVATAPENGVETVVEPALDLLASALRDVYARWLDEPDPVDWWREIAVSSATLPRDGPLLAISHPQLREYAARLERAVALEPGAQRAAALLELPDEAEIERAHLDAVEAVTSETRTPGQNQLARIHWLIRVISRDALGPVHGRAISEIHQAVRGALADAARPELELLVHEIFAGLRGSQLSRSEVALALIEKLGEEVLAGNDPDAARVVVDELLAWDFPPPAFGGFTDEWQARVDRSHLRAIRSFLAVIRCAPERARPLVAMLVVHLMRGGVFVADTDLFQKDVSALLNAEIEPVYHPIKQLLRLFPVYFEDVGAEGELREVSSRIDEIGARKDLLCHFLRKQCHVESNPRLLGFVDAIGAFWADGNPSGLQLYLPPALYERCTAADGRDPELGRVFSAFAAGEGVQQLAARDAEDLEKRLAQVSDPGSAAAEKSRLLVRLRLLLGRKYELGHEDLLERLASSRRFAENEIAALGDALARGDDERALDALIGMLEALRGAILSGERSEGEESIYRKRHIAVGIPSMYGRYREEKLDALGLSFRIESLANTLFDRLLAVEDREYVTRDGLRRTRDGLRLLLRAVRVDGCRARGLAAGIAMFEEALAAEATSIDQYVNIFQILERGVERLIRIRFIDVYQEVMGRVLSPNRVGVRASGPDAEGEVLKDSEAMLRALIAQSFGLQALDRLIAKTLRTLVGARERFEPATLRLLLAFDSERCCLPIEAEPSPLDGAILLGNKGYQIRRLAIDGLPVPPGFVLTTDLCRCWPAIRECEDLRRELRERIGAQIERLETVTGLGFGDPERPLLLSVRSGSAISMPGLLDTFLDVGISAEIAEGLAVHRESPWGAWDAYRRFLQFWGMGHGIERDRFDGLMRALKAEAGVEKKVQIPPAAMREGALRYRRLLIERGVAITEDPAEQLERCVELVLRSWDSEKARAYRAEMHIAEEWGTAVVVQAMVFGNLHERSGTGVALTCDPRRPSEDVQLYGDFVAQGQGDDVVAGLVETRPISEEQARGGDARSLERDFPLIHRALLEHARVLIRDRGMFHQEIEFTFESDQPGDLFILQTRDCTLTAPRAVCAFVPSEELDRALLATGIGAGGDALCGRLAHTAEDVKMLRIQHPGDPIILVRSDTVPDDIPLVLQTDGMLTALGGATSHAALVAQQLGRTCVVGCRQLEVDEAHGRSRLGDRTLLTGTLVSISGLDGSVYLGRHATTDVG